MSTFLRDLGELNRKERNCGEQFPEVKNLMSSNPDLQSAGKNSARGNGTHVREKRRDSIRQNYDSMGCGGADALRLLAGAVLVFVHGLVGAGDEIFE
jgi:hypothetical protein